MDHDRSLALDLFYYKNTGRLACLYSNIESILHIQAPLSQGVCKRGWGYNNANHHCSRAVSWVGDCCGLLVSAVVIYQASLSVLML